MDATPDNNSAQEANLEGLIDPDATAERPAFKFDDAIQDEILAAMVFNLDMLAFASNIVEPKSFTVKGNSSIAAIALDYYGKYHALPPKVVVEAELKEKYKDDKAKVYYISRLNALEYQYHPGLVPLDYLKHKLTVYAKQAAVKKAFHRFLSELDQGNLDLDSLHKAYCEEFDQIKALEVSDDQLVGLDAVEFFEHAQAEQREWLLDNWIASGSVHLFAGSKKIGKSTLVHSLIPALITGKPWFGKIPTVQSHVLYIDLENPLDYIRDNLLENMTKDEWAAVKDQISIPLNRPSIITGDWLKRYMEKNELGGKRGVVFIDSAFAAFNGLFAGSKRVWENTGSDVRTALKPLEEVARATGWAIVLIHHDNKSGDTGGSAQWEGAVDYIWHYTAKAETRQLEAKWGRWVKARPQAMTFAKPESKLLFAGYSKEVKQMTTEKKLDEKLDELLPHIPDIGLDGSPCQKNTITQAELRDKTGLSNAEVSKRIAVLEERQLIQKAKLGSGNESRMPWRYWQVSAITA